MELSIVVLTYNHPELSARAAASARSVSGREPIIVHNGSEPRHVERVRREHPEAEHLVLEPNRGYGGGANAGLQLAFERAPWAILLTNDSTLVNLPELPRAPAIVAPKVLRRNKGHIDSAGGLFFPAHGRLRHCRNVGEFLEADSRQGVRRYIPGTAFLVHRDVFSAAGPLREELCIYWDDVEWSQRIARTGFPLLVDERWIVRHGMSKTGQSDPLYSTFYFQRNRKWICWEFTERRIRALLIARLLSDWARLFTRNALRKRWRALGLLVRAAIS